MNPSRPDPANRARGQSARFAAMYGALFLAVGIYLPYWPLWLAGRGLAADQIGLILALATWAKVLSGPAAARIADRTGRARATMAVAAGLSLLCFLGLFGAREFWAILVFNLLAGAFFPILMPLTESQAMAAVVRDRLDYGRIRLWGSLAFILATVGTGYLLTGRNPEILLFLVMAATAATLIAALALPGAPAARSSAGRGGFLILLRNPSFVLFLAASGLLASSHAVYYGFSALHWRAAGLSEAVIGWLWVEGVVAEILLFAAGGAVVARIGPVGLLLAAGIAGVLRWTVLGATTALPALFVAQAMHGATFGAAHLGAMHFIVRVAPAGLAATAQSLFSAIGLGLAMGLAMLVSGRLYEILGGGAFFAMAGLSALGTVAALALARRQRMRAISAREPPLHPGRGP